MALLPGEAEVLFQFLTPQTLDPATRSSGLAALADKIGRMDTTNIRGTWKFTLGPNDPTPADAVKFAKDYLALLVGDETVIAQAEVQPVDFIYCVFGDNRVCYQSIGVYRTVGNTDTAWGGDIGPNSRVAWRDGDVIVPLNVVFRFARAL